MTLQDIKDTIADHVHSAKCAIEAGFDGVEIVSLCLPDIIQLILFPTQSSCTLSNSILISKGQMVTYLNNSSTATLTTLATTNMPAQSKIVHVFLWR